MLSVAQSDINRDFSRRVVVVGGGFSAASFAVQLLRYTPMPVELTVVEPRHGLGRGLAYSATDPDHRLNAPLDVHWIDPAKPLELRQWCEAQGVFDADPECLTPNGQVFLRRSDMGTYLSAQIEAESRRARLGSSVRHIRDTAVSAHVGTETCVVHTSAHGAVEGDMLVVATGNPEPSLRAPFQPEEQSHPRVIANPLNAEALSRIRAEDRVLVVGSGLTALDAVSTLVRREHSGGILVVSRRGYRPRAQSPETLNMPPRPIELCAEIPEFLAGQPSSVAAWTRALRKEIKQKAEEGIGWHSSFDALRDVTSKLWPRLSTKEKLRFLRRLRVLYNVHRFRAPPMNDVMVASAERQGHVRYAAATLCAVDTSPTCVNVRLVPAQRETSQWHEFDFVINCTGLDAEPAWRSNLFAQSLLADGRLRIHPTGIGFDVDEQCQATRPSGVAQPRLRVIGPPSAGAFGDPVAIPFIANQVQRILPDVVRTLQLPWSNEGIHEHASTA